MKTTKLTPKQLVYNLMSDMFKGVAYIEDGKIMSQEDWHNVTVDLKELLEKYKTLTPAEEAFACEVFVATCNFIENVQKQVNPALTAEGGKV